LDDSIDSLRTQIYVSAIVARDSLLDTSPERLASYTAELNGHRTAALAAMERVGRLASAAHAKALESLARENSAYWESVLQVVGLTGAERASLGYTYVRTRVIPKRESLLTIAGEFSDLQAAETTAAQRRLSQTVAEFRSGMARLRTIAITVCAVVAILCTWRVYRLQRSAEAERVRRNDAEAKLRQLTQVMVHAQEDERRSLSRELHDQVGQWMTALRFRLGNIEAENPQPTPAFRQMVEECRSLLEGTIETIRQMAMGLRPAMLDDLGMTAAIEWHAREFSRRFDIPVSLDVAASATDVPEPQRTHVYRIVQEALTNCARHAKATSVDINLSFSNRLLSLLIIDNGVGLQNGARSRNGFGLAGIEERVREMHGTFSAYSPQHGGTVLEVKIPVPEGKGDAKD
jgi:signal transduction histidine kinase